MSRLTAALDRASKLPGRAPGPEPAPAGAALAWQLDAADATPEPAAPPSSTFGHRFSDAAATKVVVHPDADFLLVEQYRRLAAVLHHAQDERGVRTVMIASAVASEGKTLTATNLALTLSHSFQRRVLLIDADLRRPSVHQVFQLPNRDGLIDRLRREAGGTLPVARVSPTLWVLTGGRPDADPMSALVSGTMRQLLADAAAQFDWVVVDTPPVGILPDANLLAAMIDVALLVVSANSTPYPLVKRAVEAIGAQRILGVVFNRVARLALADRYGDYGYYYGARGDQARA
jgi:capsular exopolysaccharide synthesis family protein